MTTLVGAPTLTWQNQLLAMLGAPATPANLQFLNAWRQAEGGTASYNPFNTTLSEPGATNYNSVGVKNYKSEQQGLQATVATLGGSAYNAIVAGLRSGKATAVQLAQAVANSPWGTGSGVLRVLGAGSVNPPPLTGPTTTQPAGLFGGTPLIPGLPGYGALPGIPNIDSIGSGLGLAKRVITDPGGTLGHALLYVLLLILGVVLIYEGVIRTLGASHPSNPIVELAKAGAVAA